MKQRLLELLCTHSYIEGTVKLASGKMSDFYVDCRKTALLPEGHHLIGAICHDLITTHFPQAEAVGGVVLGACPLASATSMASFSTKNPLPAFYLRKEAKGHGMGRLLEGPVKPGARVVILEDVVTTGGSTISALESAKVEELEVLGVISLVDRQENNGAALIAREVPYFSIFTKSDILAHGKE
ncbi:orotate phosphoribosyltransferase [Myxococcota bacterium]|nr:orotate phosphoribosyltransferase [Myxococcota bacterium]MBU1537974.1 orotate phosphoribosyltransferase [Myxococcota bacterium]